MSNKIELLPPAIIDENDAHMEIIHKRTNSPRFQRGSKIRSKCTYAHQLAPDFALKIDKIEVFPNGEQVVSIHKKNAEHDKNGYSSWYSITIAHYPYDAIIDTYTLDLLALAINKTMNASRLMHTHKKDSQKESLDQLLKSCQYEFAKLLIEGVTSIEQIEAISKKIPANIFVELKDGNYYKLKEKGVFLSNSKFNDQNPILLKGQYGADFFYIGDYDIMYKKEEIRKRNAGQASPL